MAVAGQSFRSRLTFLLAATGFAVGLGNIWRFPYVAGENGGSAFVLVYLACVLIIGVPILMAEIIVGRRGGATPPSSLGRVATESNRSDAWRWVGYLNLVTAFTIQVVYVVVIGWVLYYLYLALSGNMAEVAVVGGEATFNSLLADVPTLIGYTVIGLLLAAAIIYAGVQNGIERAVRILMPMLFILMVALAVFNIFNGGMPEALAYLFTPDFSKLSPEVALAAVGQAFFSIGVGMAGMMMFGAYLPKEVSIGSSALMIVMADTGVALLAGLVIFPMVFNYGLDPAGGAGLIFQTLTVAFASMEGGTFIGGLFFLLLSVAGVTSLVGLFEPVAAWVSERFSVSRARAVVFVSIASMVGSLISVLSYNYWAAVQLFGMSLADGLDFVPNQIFLPLGGLLIATFVGWRMSSASAAEELNVEGSLFNIWFNSLRFVAVPVVLVIFVTGLLA